MKALILEDDELIAELLQSIVAGLYPGVSVSVAHRLAGGMEQVRQSRFNLLLVDWNLPDGSGLELVRKVRQIDKQVPVVVISARADRKSVISAAHCGISGYITKPFGVETVRQRLADLLKPPADIAPPTVTDLLSSSLRSGTQLSASASPAIVLQLMAIESELSPTMLAEKWSEEEGLIARLMEVANSTSFRRSGTPVETLREAVVLMGVPLALQQALAIALDVSNTLSDPALRDLAANYHNRALTVARQAQGLALRMGKSPTRFHQAGMLSRIGELSTLRVLHEFHTRGGELAEGEAQHLLRDWAQAYGNALKIQWRLPLGLREMIGAVHSLPSGSVREDLLVMRAAALAVENETNEGQEYQRLLRRIGLDSEKEW